MDKIRTFPELISIYSRLRPSTDCIVCENRRYNYLEVDRIISILAERLRIEGVLPKAKVAVCGNRSELMLFHILSIIRAGACYVPIDNHDPIERIAFICKESEATVILSDGSISSSQHFINCKLINYSISDINHLLQKPCFRQFKDIERNINEPIAIYFTSGTTGLPKGVIHSSCSIHTSNASDQKHFNYNINDRILLYTHFSICFSVTVFAGLLSGASIYIATDSQCDDLISLKDYAVQNEITVLHMPTIVGYEFSKIISTSSIRLMILGGSVFPKLDRSVDYHIVNVYGSTEGMALSYIDCNDSTSNSSLGLPCKHCEWMVSDFSGHQVRSGEIGELMVSGLNLSAGYLNSPELTKERFVIINSKRFFKTHDVVKECPDGSYYFVGRMDSMVKINGHRVCLEEVEFMAREIPAVLQAVACCYSIKGRNYLCLYYKTKYIIGEGVVKSYLKKHLPQYMIPHFFCLLDEFPLTERGKIDYSNLPVPQVLCSNHNQVVSEFEDTLIRLVKRVLPVADVSLEESFSELGGDSLSLLMLCYELKTSGICLPQVTDLLNSPLKHIALELEKMDSTQRWVQEYGSTRTQLSSICKRVLHLNDISNVNHFIIPEVLKVCGRIDMVCLKKTIEVLVRRHPILASVVVKDDELEVPDKMEEIQIIETYAFDKDAGYYKKEISSFFHNFDITKKLFGVLVVHLYRDDILVFGYHHFISDGISKILIFREMVDVYCSFISGDKEVTNAIEKTFFSYRNFLLDNINLIRELEGNYWANILSEISNPRLPISSDCGFFSIYAKMEGDVVEIVKHSSKMLTYGVLPICMKVMKNVICSLFETNRLSVQIYRHGRTGFSNLDKSSRCDYSDINSSIGCFTISHPVNLELMHNEFDIDELLLDVPSGGVGFDLLGGYSNCEVPLFGVDYVGENDIFPKNDALFKNFSKVKGLSGEAVDNELNMGCEYLMYIVLKGTKMYLQARCSSKYFSFMTASEILDKVVESFMREYH